MIIKTSELEGAALDWAVGKATGHKPEVVGDSPEDMMVVARFIPGITPENGQAFVDFSPSTDWNQGGPLIERFRVSVSVSTIDRWCAVVRGMPWYADKPLIAAMRAIVAAELGDTVDVPKELLS